MNPDDLEGEGCRVVLGASPHQPHIVKTFLADDIYIMQISIPAKDSLIPQHTHKYDHMTMLVTGAAAVWEDGKYKGEVYAPDGIFIKANVRHSFLTLQDNTTVYCVHNISRSGGVEYEKENQVIGKELSAAL